MRLESLQLSRFRNYHDQGFDLGDKVVCISGRNGSGKTNLLDAIHYLSMGKSYFSATDAQTIAFGERFFRLEAKLTVDEAMHLVCIVEEGKRKVLRRDGRDYDRLSDHLGLMPVVMIAPDDIVLVKGDSRERRRLMDSILGQVDKSYLHALLEYQRLLKHRNALLKQFAQQRQFDRDLLASYDQPLAEHGQVIYTKRQRLVEVMLPIVRAHYDSLLEEPGEHISLSYETDLEGRTNRELLKSSLDADRKAQRTTAGVHRDDLVIELNARPAKRFASQGQSKSCLLALKLTQYTLMHKALHREPLLLLDDIFDKLDGLRSRKLMDLAVGERLGQVFITDTSRERMEAELGTQASYIEI